MVCSTFEHSWSSSNAFSIAPICPLILLTRLRSFSLSLVVCHGKFVLTDDRSMIDWGAFGAPRRVDCDGLYRQPQTALQHRRISRCVRPAVREEEVAMVR